LLARSDDEGSSTPSSLAQARAEYDILLGLAARAKRKMNDLAASLRERDNNGGDDQQRPVVRQDRQTLVDGFWLSIYNSIQFNSIRVGRLSIYTFTSTSWKQAAVPLGAPYLRPSPLTLGCPLVVGSQTTKFSRR
jgi:hypothetical protein